MGTEDDLRELIGRMAAAQRGGVLVEPAHRRVVLAALRAYLAGRAWVAKPPDPRDDAPRRQAQLYTGPPATLADLRRHGLLALAVTCSGPTCRADGRVPLEALGLDDATPVPDIPRLRGFRCRRCGGRRVHVAPDWSDRVVRGAGRISGG